MEDKYLFSLQALHVGDTFLVFRLEISVAKALEGVYMLLSKTHSIG
jgi:hypothetical protein